MQLNLTRKRYPGDDESHYGLFSAKKVLDEQAFQSLRAAIFDLIKNSPLEETKTNSRKTPNCYFTLGGGYGADTTETINRAIDQANLSSNKKHAINHFISIFERESVVNEISNLLGIRNLKVRNSNYKKNIYDLLLRNIVLYLNIKVSAYPPGSGIALHRDNQRKFIGCLYYLGFTDGVERTEGGTQFYFPKRPLMHRKDEESEHQKMEDDNLHLRFDSTPESNSISIFEINDFSWHSVAPWAGPPGVYRVNIQMNYMRNQNPTIGYRIGLKIKWVFSKLIRLILHTCLSRNYSSLANTRGTNRKL